MKIVKEQDLSYLKRQKRKNLLLAFVFLSIGSVFIIIFWLLTPPIWLVSLWFLRDWRNWKKGIEGEKEVASFLRSLDDSFRVLHGLIIDPDYGDIDHLVIGPSGIFALETKNWTGKVEHDGKEWHAKRGMLFDSMEKVGSPSDQILDNSDLLEDRLGKRGIPIKVKPVIVFPNRDLELELNSPENSGVMIFQSREELLEYLKSRPETLTEEEVDSICETLLEIKEEN